MFNITGEQTNKAPVEEFRKKFLGKIYLAAGESKKDAVKDKPVSSCMCVLWGIVSDFSFKFKSFTDADIKYNSYRILAPNSIMTMDYRTERLNFRLNENGEVTDVYSG